MYSKFDWFFEDKTGIYDDTRKLMNNPPAFILALLLIDEERHRHAIAEIERNVLMLEKKNAKRQDAAYDPQEDYVLLATLRGELVEIRASIQSLRKERDTKQKLVAPPVKNAPKRRTHRKMFLFRRH